MDDAPSARVLLDHAQDKVVVLDGRGQFTYANQAVKSILGYDPADLIGDSAFEYIHPDDVAEAEAAFERTISSDSFTETTVEYRFRASDGSWVWLESRMSNLTDDELDGYVVSSRDISDRVAAERDQKETAMRLEELAATTGDVLWLFNGDWTELLFANSAFETVYGCPVEDIETDPRAFLNSIHPDDVPMVEEAMERLSEGESVDLEYRVNPDEDYGVWVWVQAEPIVEDGEVARISGFTRDVTDRRRRERQLYVMDNLLRHNLRNDLTTIVGNADLIEANLPEAADQTAVIRQTSEDLLASAEKERRIINLLTTETTQNRIELGDVIERSVEVVRERYPAMSIDVTCPESMTVVAVAELQAAVVELLENAVRHSEQADPTVCITVRRDGAQVVMNVEDNAPQIPEIESRVLVGDHEMNDVYHSSGLGLWLVYWVVELSDGTTAVSTVGDQGNRIQLTLPSARE